MDTQTGEILGIRPITDTIRKIGGGQFIDAASDKLAELVAAVEESGKPGKINLCITVKKASRGGAMLVTGTATLAKPAEPAMECMLFATPDGNLVVDDPKQQRLDLKSVAGAVEVNPASLKTA
jgi:hypothetical protein